MHTRIVRLCHSLRRLTEKVMFSAELSFFFTQETTSTMNSTQSQINKDFVKKFKKDNGIKVQTKLPTAIDLFSARVISDGCTATDGAWWRRFCEQFKLDPAKYGPAMTAMLDICRKCGDAKPWELIRFGRQTYGFTTFDENEIHMLEINMLADLDADDDDKDSGSYEETGAPYDPSQPYPDNPTSEEAYAIDDDDEAAYEAARGKRKVRPGEEMLE